MTEWEQAVRNAARALYAGAYRSMEMTPREAAEAAHYAGGPSVDELEQRIIEFRQRFATPRRAAA